jgi:acyl-coenzyme A synthetase/AMP-(fatty) acid ligase
MARVAVGLIADTMRERVRPAPFAVDRPLDLAPELGLGFTRGAVADLILDTSARLAAAGATAGSRVAVCKANGFDIPVLALACRRIGAVPALISGAMEAPEAAELLRTVAPRLLVTDEATLDRGALAGQDAAGLAERLCVADADGARGLPASGAPVPDAVSPRDDDEVALITHSSGTTGLPKLVVQSTATFGATVDMNRRMARLTRIRGPVAGNMSLVHLRSVAAVAALLTMRQPTLVIGGEDPEASMRLLAGFRPEMVEAHPAGYLAWEPYLGRYPDAFARTRLFGSNFDASHPRTIKALLAASRRRHPLYVGVYGQSESGPVTSRADSRLTAEHADGRCVGYPMPGLSHVRVRRDPGGGRIGKIEARSKALCVDYLGRSDLYGEKRNGKWWDMGDRGYRSRFGCLHLLDREVDVIEELESLLAVEDTLMERFPQVQEVVLVPDGDGHPRPVLATYDGADLPAEQWHRGTDDLPRLGEPLSLRYEEIPRTATGKVRRHRLRDLLEQPRSDDDAR